MKDEATKAVETIAGERCPCGHLRTRHRKPAEDWIEGIRGVLGPCRDCDCRGLLQIEDDPRPGLVGVDNA